MKKILLPHFTEHLEYLFTLSRKARERHPDYISLKDILTREGHWRRLYRLSPNKKHVLQNNLKGGKSGAIRTTDDDYGSMYDD